MYTREDGDWPVGDRGRKRQGQGERGRERGTGREGQGERDRERGTGRDGQGEREGRGEKEKGSDREGYKMTSLAK